MVNRCFKMLIIMFAKMLYDCVLYFYKNFRYEVILSFYNFIFRGHDNKNLKEANYGCSNKWH